MNLSEPLIREMTLADLDELYALLSDSEVMRYIEPPFSKEQTMQFLVDAGLSEKPLVYAVEDSGSFIGYKSLGGSHSAREDTEVSAGNVPVAERERKTERTGLPGAEPAVPEEFFCKCFPLWGLCRPLVFGRL